MASHDGRARIPERALIGALLKFPEHHDITRAFDILTAECFADPRHRVIFGILEDESRFSGKIPPLEQMVNVLNRTGAIEVAGGAEYLAELADFAPTAANWEFHARLVHLDWVRRQLVRIGELDPDRRLDTPALLREADGILASAQTLGTDLPPTRIKHALWPVLERIESSRMSDEHEEFLKTEIPGLDSVIQGWPVGACSLVAGQRGVGRTTFAIMTAVAAAARGEVTVVVSADQDNCRLASRALALGAEMPIWKIEPGARSTLRDDDFATLARAAGLLTAAPMYLAGGTAPTLATLRAMVRSEEFAGVSRLLVLDGCDEMFAPELNVTLRGLKLLAAETSVAIVVTVAIDADDRLTLVPGTPDLHPFALEADVFVRLSDGRRPGGRRRTGDRLVNCCVEWNRCSKAGEVVLQFRANRTRFERPVPQKPPKPGPAAPPMNRARNAGRRQDTGGDPTGLSLL